MNDTDAHLYDIDTFSAGQAVVRGPRELAEPDALAYLAQRMADQHAGALAPSYWQKRAQALLEEASERPGASCSHRIARGRGVILAAEPVKSSAVFEVRVFPLFDDDGEAGELCAAWDHPRLAVAMREAGVRAESWMRVESEAVRAEQERGELVGFEAQVTARLAAPLLPQGAAKALGEAVGAKPAHAPLECGGERVASVPASPAA